MIFESATAQGILCLAALTVFAVATGLGLLFLLRFPDDRRSRVLLAPLAATMLWAVAGDLSVRLGFTMQQVTLPIWLGSMLLALVGLFAIVRDRPAAIDRHSLLLGAVILGATGLGMAVPIGRGLFSTLGAGNPDTYLYTSLAAALWEHGLTREHLSSFFELLRGHLVLATFRNHTFVLLAFFSRLVEAGEPLFVRNLFACWTLVTLGGGAAYYLRATRRDLADGGWAPVLYVCFVMSLGWAYVPAAVGNWDNALFVAVVPVLAGLASEPAGWRFAVALGLTVAYGFLTYPELFPVAGVVVAPFYIARLVRERTQWRSLAVRGVAAVAVAGVAIAPAAGSLWGYFVYQMQTAVTAMRPGGMFAYGLVQEWWNPAVWWAFGQEHGVAGGPLDVALAVALTGLLIAGIVRAARTPADPVIWALAVTTALIAYFLGIDHYAYGVYKILSVTWWLFAQLLLDGLVGIWRAVRGHRAPEGGMSWRTAGPAMAFAAVASVLLVTAVTLSATRRMTIFSPDWALRELPATQELIELRDRTRQLPAGDIVITGTLAAAPSMPWILYALRSTPLRVYISGHPQPYIPETFTWAKPTLPDRVLVGSDARPAGNPGIIDTPRFTLIDMRRSALVTNVDSPNGMETWGTWLGVAPITITVVAQEQLALQLDMEAEPGPSRPESTDRTLVLSSPAGEVARVAVTSRERVSLPLTVTPGTTRLTLTCLEPPTVATMPNGDVRPLLVAIRGLAVNPATIK